MENKSLISIVVENLISPQRIDKWISEASHLKEFLPTRSYIQNLIDSGAVTVNGKIVKSSYTLKTNDVVQIQIPEKKPTALLPYKFPLEIIFEDSDVLVINKPSGLVVHPAAGHEQDTLVNALLSYTKDLSMKNEERPGIVHRIDKETSGLLVIAKNDFSHDELSKQFKDKTTHRIYYAITEGSKVLTSGTIKSYLARHSTDRKKFASIKNKESTEGKFAVTYYQLLQSVGGKHLYKLQLETGRTHQIRVHMSENGHPLVGDSMYGYSVKKIKDEKIKRFFLHAAELGFKHPRTNEFLSFKSIWPDEDLKQIRTWGFQYEF